MIRGLVCGAVVVAALLSGNVFGQLPRESRVPGGVAHVSTGISATESAPKVLLGTQQVWVTPVRGMWTAIVGIPLSSQPGPLSIQIERDATAPRTETIDVRTKAYPTQKLTLKNPAMVDPPAEVQARIAQERAHLSAVLTAFRGGAPTPASARAALDLPAIGRLSSRYGVARVLNGKPRAPHAGLDVAVPTGTPVTAAAAGDVVDAGDYYYCGKTMILDHGGGMVSLHCHLSELIAYVGAGVRAGEQIARSGNTGRSTGPHLHWSVYLNGTSVDPELFIAPAGTPEPTKKPK